MSKELLDFLKSQRIMTIASAEGGLWLATVYYGIAEDERMFFVSPKQARHSQQILQNPNIAFAVAWYDMESPGNRKAVQGLGACVMAKDERDIRMGVQLHNHNFPQFAHELTPEYVLHNTEGTSVWMIAPTYIKFWNDELYGTQQTQEFTL
jgi:uncharacterized protein YhbP (UPF0306 family)